MGWKRKGKKDSEMHEHLMASSGKTLVPKGCVPVIVGCDDEAVERFIVSLRFLNEPCIVELLEMAAGEFGYEQEGPLRIPCDVEHFRRVVSAISQST